MAPNPHAAGEQKVRIAEDARKQKLMDTFEIPALNEVLAGNQFHKTVPQITAVYDAALKASKDVAAAKEAADAEIIRIYRAFAKADGNPEKVAETDRAAIKAMNDLKSAKGNNLLADMQAASGRAKEKYDAREVERTAIVKGLEKHKLTNELMKSGFNDPKLSPPEQHYHTINNAIEFYRKHMSVRPHGFDMLIEPKGMLTEDQKGMFDTLKSTVVDKQPLAVWMFVWEGEAGDEFKRKLERDRKPKPQPDAPSGAMREALEQYRDAPAVPSEHNTMRAARKADAEPVLSA